ncbi:hypothetical protein ACTQ49_01065 [Luteococcus sp. Sow4_B9]|uniref:hypothetical protein n=1 Tax=Luteococcus sp. Sow4_B9 TaxID=3438792 RepID=UPI003F97AF78
MIRSRAAVAVVAAAISFAAAPAAFAAPNEASAWASFSSADAWINQENNFRWYVATPTITEDMVGQTVTMTAQSSPMVDCSALSTGYSTATGWVNTEATLVRCNPAMAVLTFVVDEGMVGSDVQVNGWVDAGKKTTGTVRGTVEIAGTTYKATQTVNR